MQVTGNIKVKGETQTFGSNGFRKRELVVTTEDDKYPQDIMLELHQDKVDLLDTHNVGDKVTVSINLRGKMWTNDKGEDKYFNSLVGWRIEKAEATANSFETTSAPITSDNDSGLPF